jgi:acetolactate synthase-1/2/3 large subunit
LIDNRRGSPELLADVGLALDAITDALGNDAGKRDTAWLEGLRAKNKQRTAKGETAKAPQTGEDGKIHPMAIFDAIKAHADPDYIAIADGGDLLSFARIGLEASTYMDAGAFGCLGVGVPFAVAASLAFPGRQVISVNGDGAFRPQCNGNRHCRAPRRNAGVDCLEQRGVEHRAFRPGHQLWRPRCRHHASTR